MISSPALHLLTAISSRPPMSREAASVVLQPPLLCATGGLPPQLTHAYTCTYCTSPSGTLGRTLVREIILNAGVASCRPTRCETQSTHPLHCDDLQFFSQSQWHQEVHWPAADEVVEQAEGEEELQQHASSLPGRFREIDGRHASRVRPRRKTTRCAAFLFE